MKQNNNKKLESIFNRNKVKESLKHKKMTHYKRYKSNGKKRKRIHMT